MKKDTLLLTTIMKLMPKLTKKPYIILHSGEIEFITLGCSRLDKCLPQA
jgi:hypothetical protein